MSDWSAQRRLTLIVLVTLATVAATLAAGGLFGVIGFMVSRRTSEIGIRRALGANDASVVGLVTRQGIISVAVGMAGGLVGAFALSRLAAALLFQVSPTDPVTFCLVPILLGIVAGTGSVHSGAPGHPNRSHHCTARRIAEAVDGIVRGSARTG